MPDSRKHRGPGPEDGRDFGPSAVPPLRAAAGDLAWLLSRGYAEASSLKLVGDRHRLVERQRTAVLRSSCPDEALARRRERCLGADDLRGRSLRVDGFNLILTLESALGGGVVLGGRDGSYRDLAGVHGTYRRVAETQPALELAATWLRARGVAGCHWLLDAPVSNSGRLAALIRAADPTWTAEVVPDPDRALARPGDPIATADAGILDRCGAWVALSRRIVDDAIPGAFVVDLG